jgi:threonine dehydrogenase-like Zn-dependent dehydrogenase
MDRSPRGLSRPVRRLACLVVASLAILSGPPRAAEKTGADKPAAAKDAKKKEKEYERELHYLAPQTNPRGDNWHPGDGPSQALRWMVQAVAKAGTISIIGVYPTNDMVFPIGVAMNKNLTINAGNCNHRKYIPLLLEKIRTGALNPAKILTKEEPLTAALDAYRAFDQRAPGWIKVMLEPTKLAA